MQIHRLMEGLHGARRRGEERRGEERRGESSAFLHVGG
jgi:hypothetical protein